MRELAPAVGGSQEAGFTQPRDRLLAHLCRYILIEGGKYDTEFGMGYRNSLLLLVLLPYQLVRLRDGGADEGGAGADGAERAAADADVGVGGHVVRGEEVQAKGRQFKRIQK